MGAKGRIQPCTFCTLSMHLRPSNVDPWHGTACHDGLTWTLTAVPMTLLDILLIFRYATARGLFHDLQSS